jgi:peptidoglycan/LPS O-acetylase OafA/YrhL
MIKPHPVAHYEYLDALRGLAIIGVIIVHSSIVSKQVGWLATLSFTGQRGVQLFYVVSAFTLYLSMRARWDKEKHPISNFFIRRFFRIAPLFYLAIFANIIYLYFFNLSHPSIFDFILGFTFLHGLKPQTINSVAIGGWSIAVETSFYFILPFIFQRVINLKKSVLLLIVSSLCAPLLSYLLCYHVSWSGWISDIYKNQPEYFFFTWFPIEFPVFCMGIIAVYLKDFIDQSITVEARKTLSLILIAVSAILFIQNIPIHNNTLYLSSLGFVPLLLGLSLKPWKVFVNKYIVYIGKISYSIYLVHFFVLIMIENLLIWIEELTNTSLFFGSKLGFPVVVILVSLGSFFISYATWRWIETPGILLGRSIIAKRET